MKFSSVLLSEDSSARPYQMCGQISTFPEKKDLMHNVATKSNRISCISMHWATTTNQPNQTGKKKKTKKHYSRWLLSITCTRVTVMTAVSSTIILPLPPNQPFDQITSTNKTKLAASSNTTDGTAKTLLKLTEVITKNHGHFAPVSQCIWTPHGFGPPLPVHIRWRIWTLLRRFELPYQTFLLSIVYIVFGN